MAMGDLIKTFTFDRNTLKRNALSSAEAVHRHIAMVKNRDALDKTASNIIAALAHYMGVFSKSDDGYTITPLSEAFESLYAKNRQDAFQWLLTRALWRFAVPNGTACRVNTVAGNLGVRFSLFPCLLGLVLHLQARPRKERFLYHEEFCRIYDDDGNWSKPSAEIFSILLEMRKGKGIPASPKRLLDNLETAFSIPRDNLNTYLHKALSQTGLLEELAVQGSPVALTLSQSLDEVLQRRIRYIIDNPVIPDLGKESWEGFLSLHDPDLPQEAAAASVTLPMQTESDKTLAGLVRSAETDFQAIGLRLQPGLLDRLVASLLAKPFVILTGLSGSGKTKIANALAVWLTEARSASRDPFVVGAEIKSTRISYFVEGADSISVVLTNKAEPNEATRVCLPRDLISEWLATITSRGFDRDTSARTIREAVAETTKYSPQINSFETHLKAAAFAMIDAGIEPGPTRDAYVVIAVGADWTNRDPLLGYPDALSPGTYCMPASQALQLVLAAKNDPTHPYFLILDEMNLSHVERYFADILSAMESREPVALHENRAHRDGEGNPIPEKVVIPPNLFVIGTVNVDETTYMFSPKVLDRAGVIEFAVTASDIEQFLESPTTVEISQLAGRGVAYAEDFVRQAGRTAVSLDEIGTGPKEELRKLLGALFVLLADAGAEFGYRPLFEITRFVCFHSTIGGASWNLDAALDAAVMQKLLPKLHGSKTRLGPILSELKKVITPERFPTSADKIARMEKRLKRNGFTSYAEA
jgi:hypothetical protein